MALAIIGIVPQFPHCDEPQVFAGRSPRPPLVPFGICIWMWSPVEFFEGCSFSSSAKPAPHPPAAHRILAASDGLAGYATSTATPFACGVPAGWTVEILLVDVTVR